MDKQDYIITLLETTNALLSELIEKIDSGIHIKRSGNNDKYASSSPLSQDDFDALDEEIDLEWWFISFGEENRPARYMNQSGSPLSKQESDYMFRRLLDISSVEPKVNGGTHVFKYIGKKYSPIDKNTFNCFACVPTKEKAPEIPTTTRGY